MAHPITENERQIFDYLLRPDDSYDENGVYWADMPLMKRAKFVSSYDNAEAKRELKAIGSMIKKDPLSPIAYYFRNMVLPGAGLGLEGYVLFSIGNITPLFTSPGPFASCWKGETCSANWVNAIQYLEVVGIIIGQVLVGVLGDWLGRRWGLIQDAAIMFVGLIMLTAAWGITMEGWIICYAFSLLFYGVGVGGEYPMTATSGMENAVGSGKISTKEDRLHRGRKVTSAFTMQGWGQFFNQVILIILLIIFNSGTGTPPYLPSAVQWTYRVSFAIPAVGTLWLVYYRAYKMKAASKQLQAAKAKSNVTGYDTKSLKMTFSYFGPRLIATAGCWFANDVFFYGNKLFQSNFISIVSSDSKVNVMPGWLYNLINVGVSLCGYYMAVFFIDNKLYGRRNMQMVGFALCFILFVIPAFKFSFFEKQETQAFQAMYFLSSFFNQFGPNCVTFLVAAEVYPTPVRATAHGFSAAAGKLGALLAAVVGNYLSPQNKFYFVPWFGLLGMILTMVFLPDTTGLDLKEQERRWKCIVEGREQDYHGVAVHPRHLSLWERMRGAGKYYDPEADYRQKINEMRAEWEEEMDCRGKEKAGPDGQVHVADSEWSDAVSTYFGDSSMLKYRGQTYDREKNSSDSSPHL